MASKYPQHSAPSTKIHIQSQVKEYLVYDQIFFNKSIQFGVQKPRVTPGLEGYFYYNMSGLNTDHDNVLRVDVGEDALVGKPGLRAFSNFMYGSSVSSI